MEDYMKEQLGLPLSEKIYYEKAMCLISRNRYTDQFGECLKHLYRLSMSKNDVAFHKVISSFVDNLILPKQLGINGMSYSYGGSNINFDTNPSYPIVSVILTLCRKDPFIVCLNFYLYNQSSVFLKPYYFKKK